MGRKMCLVLKYLESGILSCHVIQEGMPGDFMVPFVFEMGEWVLTVCCEEPSGIHYGSWPVK